LVPEGQPPHIPGRFREERTTLYGTAPTLRCGVETPSPSAGGADGVTSFCEGANPRTLIPVPGGAAGITGVFSPVLSVALALG
jgi:hypothetical protein